MLHFDYLFMMRKSIKIRKEEEKFPRPPFLTWPTPTRLPNQHVFLDLTKSSFGVHISHSSANTTIQFQFQFQFQQMARQISACSYLYFSSSSPLYSLVPVKSPLGNLESWNSTLNSNQWDMVNCLFNILICYYLFLIVPKTWQAYLDNQSPLPFDIDHCGHFVWLFD